MLVSGWHRLANCHTHTLKKNSDTLHTYYHNCDAFIYLFLWRQFSPFPLGQIRTDVGRELWRDVEQCRSLLDHKRYHSWHRLWINVNSLRTELQQASLYVQTTEQAICVVPDLIAPTSTILQQTKFSIWCSVNCKNPLVSQLLSPQWYNTSFEVYLIWHNQSVITNCGYQLQSWTTKQSTRVI